MNLSLFDLIVLSCDSLRGNPLRSSLTALGVFMGVAAVSATLQVRSISEAAIEKQLAEGEAPQVQVWAQSEGRLEYIEFLQKRLRGVQAISASTWYRAGESQVLFQRQEAEPNIWAVSENYLLTSGRFILEGRFFNSADFDNYRPVAVIDEFLVDSLFPEVKPVGQRIYIDRRPYTVVGVMESKQPSWGEPKGELVMPLAIHYAMTGREEIDEILVRPYTLEEMKDLEEEVEKLLKQRSPDEEFYIWNNVQKILDRKKTLEMVSRALLAVGAIALLVGGVGIANITIAAVMERTPEIGLRRALGATRFDIMLQFILEAAILSSIGGAAAIGTVHGLSAIVTDTFELPYEFEAKTAAFALGAALVVGVGAGFLPALHASKLDPVQALRSR